MQVDLCLAFYIGSNIRQVVWWSMWLCPAIAQRASRGCSLLWPSRHIKCFIMLLIFIYDGQLVPPSALQAYLSWQGLFMLDPFHRGGQAIAANLNPSDWVHQLCGPVTARTMAALACWKIACINNPRGENNVLFTLYTHAEAKDCFRCLQLAQIPTYFICQQRV